MERITGFYGKLPAKGDFLTRNLPRDFVDAWDDWLQSGMNDSRQALGDAWLQIYLTSPLWRYVLPAGVCGSSAWAGVLMPSVDKVGRFFPMTVAIRLEEPVTPLLTATAGQTWFEAVEALLLEALDDEAADLDSLDGRLQSLLMDESHPGTINLAGAVDQGFRSSLDEALDIPRALLDMTVNALNPSMQGCSLWWSHGSEHVAPSLVVYRGLPGPGKFTALLDGNWSSHGWSDGASAGKTKEELIAEIAGGFD